MNIPFKQTPSYFSTNVNLGNSGNGSKINKPTIPKIDYNPPTKFIIGRYNNNIQPTQICTLFSNSDKLYYHTNNPINGNNWINNSGLSGRGSNRGSCYKPNNWTPYDLKDSYIYNTEPNSQTAPYNPNSLFIDGSTTRAWPLYQSNNVNNSIGGLEQIIPSNEIIPEERSIDEQEYIKNLKDEMD
jgi:hypothetical protein